MTPNLAAYLALSHARSLVVLAEDDPLGDPVDALTYEADVVWRLLSSDERREAGRHLKAPFWRVGK